MRLTPIEIAILIVILVVVAAIAESVRADNSRQCIDGEMWSVNRGVATLVLEFGEPVRCKNVREIKQ